MQRLITLSILLGIGIHGSKDIEQCPLGDLLREATWKDIVQGKERKAVILTSCDKQVCLVWMHGLNA